MKQELNSANIIEHSSLKGVFLRIIFYNRDSLIRSLQDATLEAWRLPYNIKREKSTARL
jgi:hypothetical protein